MQEVRHRFVGMDPYIEQQCWEDFHQEMTSAMRSHLLPQLLDRGYDATLEQRIYLERHDANGKRRFLRPDVSVHTEKRPVGESGRGVALLEPATDVEVVELTLPMPDDRREPYIAIYKLPERRLVTVIELLSPTNKNPNADGYREYREKRSQILDSDVHLVEIDLLREGERLPTVEPQPQGDYYVYISRAERRPRVLVIAWKLNHRLPRIPIPLLKGDPDAPLDLQAAYEDAFARARYDVRLDYGQAVGSEPSG
ncbi:MAG: DUF4058 family protein [Fimbriimonadales bacterium]|nr:DUF4058 family protein [Fimbriimonadales bacterium]